MSRPLRRVVLLTPTVAGKDGVSCLARQMAEALAGLAPEPRVEVWSLTEPDVPESVLGAGITVYAAGGRRRCYVGRALVEARHDWTGALVVALHLHLLPVAWPLVARGACLLPVLIGIESWRPQRPLRRRLLARAPRALAISAHTAREFARANPELAALPVDVCHPAVPPLAEPGASPVTAQPPFALIVGRMARDERYKGHDLLIDVWRDVRREVPGARLVVVGGGDDLPRLRQRARDAGLDDAITFTGPVPDDQLTALYRDCGCFVLPSRHEGFGFVLLEAMSRGRACIGGVGAASEIIDHDRTGYVVDPDCPEEVTVALVRLLGDDALRSRFGNAGLDRARTRFGSARFADDLAASIARTCAAGHVRPC